MKHQFWRLLSSLNAINFDIWVAQVEFIKCWVKGEQNSRPHFYGYSSANVSSTCSGDNPSLLNPRSRQSLTNWIQRKDQWKPPPSLSPAALGLCRSRITILPLVSSTRAEHSSHCFCCCSIILVCTVCNADYTEKRIPKLTFMRWPTATRCRCLNLARYLARYEFSLLHLSGKIHRRYTSEGILLCLKVAWSVLTVLKVRSQICCIPRFRSTSCSCALSICIRRSVTLWRKSAVWRQAYSY